MARPRGPRIPATCEFCGKVFQDTPWRRHPYCSASCYNQTRNHFTLEAPTEWHCTRCGKSEPFVTFSIRTSGHTASECKTCTRLRLANWQKQHPEVTRRNNIKAKFGISPEEYNSLGNVCAVCRRQVSGSGRHIDHDHSTGEIRGVLCINCNMALGLTHDDADWLDNLANYLRTHS